IPAPPTAESPYHVSTSQLVPSLRDAETLRQRPTFLVLADRAHHLISQGVQLCLILLRGDRVLALRELRRQGERVLPVLGSARQAAVLSRRNEAPSRRAHVIRVPVWLTH